MIINVPFLGAGGDRINRKTVTVQHDVVVRITGGNDLPHPKIERAINWELFRAVWLTGLPQCHPEQLASGEANVPLVRNARVGGGKHRFQHGAVGFGHGAHGKHTQPVRREGHRGNEVCRHDAPPLAYLFFQSGFRFSAKAFGPSI